MSIFKNSKELIVHWPGYPPPQTWQGVRNFVVNTVVPSWFFQIVTAASLRARAEHAFWICVSAIVSLTASMAAMSPKDATCHATSSNRTSSAPTDAACGSWCGATERITAEMAATNAFATPMLPIHQQVSRRTMPWKSPKPSELWADRRFNYLLVTEEPSIYIVFPSQDLYKLHIISWR